MPSMKRPHSPANHDIEDKVSSETTLAVNILKNLPEDDQDELLDSLDVETKKDMFKSLMKQ